MKNRVTRKQHTDSTRTTTQAPLDEKCDSALPISSQQRSKIYAPIITPISGIIEYALHAREQFYTAAPTQGRKDKSFIRRSA